MRPVDKYMSVLEILAGISPEREFEMKIELEKDAKQKWVLYTNFQF